LAQRVQENVTTTPQVEGLFIKDVVRQERGSLVIHKVSVGRG
jgi:hypothetical protein